MGLDGRVIMLNYVLNSIVVLFWSSMKMSISVWKKLIGMH